MTLEEVDCTACGYAEVKEFPRGDTQVRCHHTDGPKGVFSQPWWCQNWQSKALVEDTLKKRVALGAILAGGE